MRHAFGALLVAFFVAADAATPEPGLAPAVELARPQNLQLQRPEGYGDREALFYLSIEILTRANFTLDNVQGSVRKMELVCETRLQPLTYEAGVEWNVPASWGDCMLALDAEPGSRFEIVEFADRAGTAPAG